MHVNDDDGLENEADVMGAKALQTDVMNNEQIHNDSIVTTIYHYYPVIQCIPSLDEFKIRTNINHTIRRKIKLIDTLVNNFHALNINDYGARQGIINQIINSCTIYIDLPDDKAKRKEGVQRCLRLQIVNYRYTIDLAKWGQLVICEINII